MKLCVLRHVGVIVGLIVGITAAYPFTARAVTCAQPAATVASVQGTVEARPAGSDTWQAVKLNDTYCPGDTVRAQADSRADLILLNEALLRLRANTTVTLEAVPEKRTSLIGLLKGAAHFFSRVPRSLEVRTNTVVAGVRGTEFYISAEGDRTFLTIYEGHVLASNEAGQLALTGGQSAVAEKGKAPVLRVVAKPRDAVQWALYYPPVIYAQPDKLKAGVDWQRRVGTSMEFYLQGDVQKAFDAIATVPDSIREPRFFTYRASLLLAVGRVDAANADIERALKLNPNDAEALSLQTIMAIVQNDKDKALSLAQHAVQSNPNSATAYIALSYAQQARFNLEGARASVQKAVALDAANALAWARLAELQASFGELSKSLKAARQAVKLEPNLARTQTVLGYAHLIQVETSKARVAFEKAIALDQADPLPRLGMGLAIIRDGDLTAGGRQIEIAASLAPNDSLIRSYLGKTYYEEKRTKLDDREYEMAKQLDPNDPTPWFYSAIAKQTTNRPVEALQDIEKAIELNDNRAVYRSKLLLDSDLASRSASQARIYSDLGFQQRALAEGWTSVNTDPTNYSAHRFLADSYSALPRHEIARVSELLQSQLLQPINITPIQPRLAESNLFLISSGGPGSLSFNEFNPLFNRNGSTIQASGLVGNHDTYAGEGVIAGILGKGSYSIGYTHFQTDGFRTNNDQDDDIINAFVQIEMTPKTSIQTEFRYRDNQRGDTVLRFFEDDFLPDLRQEDQTASARLGFRHAFAPNSILIGNFAYQNLDSSLNDLSFIELPAPPPLEDFFSITTNQWAFSGELQYLFRSQYFNLVGGAGYFHINTDGLLQDVVFDPFFMPPFLVGVFPQDIDTKTNHYNLYLYTYIKLLPNVTFTVGVSGDFFDQNDKVDNVRDINKNQVNPKFGITWTPLPGTTIRGAAFRTFKRTLITDQTLEPTQVAGFNQFFDDLNATKAWVYGGAIDQKFLRSLYAGVSFYYRDLEVPFFVTPPPPASIFSDKVDWKEYIGRAYLYWTPQNWVALRTGYQYERFKRDDAFTFNISEVKTHRVPIGINFIHPSGFSVGLKAEYFHQNGDFERLDAPRGEFESGNDAFWVVDAAINYRLPKRYGFITVGAANLFDKSFKYADTDLDNPAVTPDRTVFGKVTLAFP